MVWSRRVKKLLKIGKISVYPHANMQIRVFCKNYQSFTLFSVTHERFVFFGLVRSAVSLFHFIQLLQHCAQLF